MGNPNPVPFKVDPSAPSDSTILDSAREYELVVQPAGRVFAARKRPISNRNIEGGDDDELDPISAR